MIVYRCISECELACMIGINEHINAPRGSNTFKYEDNIEYKHFFYYYDSAISFMNSQNIERHYNKYCIIVAYDINNEILEKYFGLGKYNLDCIPDKHKDIILRYFKTIYYPEFAIPSNLITKNMIVGIGNQKRITPVGNTYYNKMYHTIQKSQKDFLEYEKWLLNNGTNLPEKTILDYKEILFPINKASKKINNKTFSINKI